MAIKKSTQFNVRLQPYLRRTLRIMAEAEDITEAQFVRNLIMKTSEQLKK